MRRRKPEVLGGSGTANDHTKLGTRPTTSGGQRQNPAIPLIRSQSVARDALTPLGGYVEHLNDWQVKG